MKVMVLVKATADSEAGRLPSAEEFRAMGAYNEQLVEAGIMLAGEGLHPSARGRRVRFAPGQRQVIEGPFAETRELLAGFWLWQVRSLDEATEWLKRAPFEAGTEVELRQVMDMEDFGAGFTPELQQQEHRLRERIGNADSVASSRIHTEENTR
ncbi:YciI family protein [Xanthomonas sp. 1678]|uniref:YciI family protein n=1 Tax=Xanthomonas sp. 1678 TaxID=3158788 RepID=UPI00286B66A2